MLKGGVAGLDEFGSAIDAWLDECEELIAHTARGIAVDAFLNMLRISPQFSGDFVANWNVSVDEPDTSFVPLGGLILRKDGSVRIGGDPHAISEAISRNAGKASTFTLGQSIFITNASHHTDYYAGMIEDNQIRFRPGNAGAVIARTFADIVSASRALTAGEAANLAQRVF